jgi:hypothetical protein
MTKINREFDFPAALYGAGGVVGLLDELGCSGDDGEVLGARVGLGVKDGFGIDGCCVINQPVAPIAINKNRPTAPRIIGFLLGAVSDGN